MEEYNAGKEDLQERQIVTFYLGQEEFGVDIASVRETIRLSEIVQVPQTPDYVEGICNLRGDILPIVDGRVRFGMERRNKDESMRILVVEIHGRMVGMIVDRVSEVLRVSHDAIEAAPALIRNVDTDFLQGVVKLDGGKRLIMFLDLDKILAFEVAEHIQTQAHHIFSDAQEQSVQNELLEEHLVTFLLGEEEYAFDIMHVKEIMRVGEITAVPTSTPYIDGVLSIRNQLLPIVDMRAYFGMPAAETTDRSRIIVVDMGPMSVGFKVDRVLEVIRVPVDAIEPPPKIFKEQEVEQIRGVAKLNNGKRLLMCLNAQNLLSVEVMKEIVDETDSYQVDTKSKVQAGEEEQLVAFRLGKEEFAVHITAVEEINRTTEIMKVPGTPDFIDGLVNLRGNILPVLNLRRRFGLPERGIDDATRIIIVDVGQQKNGILVDAVSGVLRFERNLVEDTPQILAHEIDTKYISGVCKLNGGKRMVMILDLGKVAKVS